MSNACEGKRSWVGLRSNRVARFLSGRLETREMAGALIDSVLSSAQRMASWLMAEHAGLERPYRMQSLLGRDLWSADELRDIVRGYVFQALGDADGVLVVDETGFVKKGKHSVGVAPVFGNRRSRREFTSERVSRLCQPLGSSADRPATLFAGELGKRPRALRQGACFRGDCLRH